jgi:hypothetical protein
MVATLLLTTNSHLEIVQKITDYWDNSPMYQSQMPVICPIEIAVYK